MPPYAYREEHFGAANPKALLSRGDVVDALNQNNYLVGKVTFFKVI